MRRRQTGAIEVGFLGERDEGAEVGAVEGVGAGEVVGAARAVVAVEHARKEVALEGLDGGPEARGCVRVDVQRVRRRCVEREQLGERTPVARQQFRPLCGEGAVRESSIVGCVFGRACCEPSKVRKPLGTRYANHVSSARSVAHSTVTRR